MTYFQILATVFVSVVVLITYRLSRRGFDSLFWDLFGVGAANTVTCELKCKDGISFSSTCKSGEETDCIDTLGTLCADGQHPDSNDE